MAEDNKIPDKQFNKISYLAGGTIILIFCASLLCINASLSQDYYAVYTLDNHYVGDIIDESDTYTGVYVMNVTQWRINHKGEKFGEQWRFSKNEIQNNIISDPDFEAWRTQKLYYANEHEIRQDLQPGDFIIVRWIDGKNGPHIKGVWNLPDFKNLQS